MNHFKIANYKPQTLILEFTGQMLSDACVMLHDTTVPRTTNCLNPCS